MLIGSGMNLPIEIVQECRDGPLLLVFAELARISGHADFHRQHVFAQALRFHKLAHNVESLIAIHADILAAHTVNMQSAAEPFELAIAIEPSDIDQMGHVNNVTYLRWVQDVAVAHWQSVAPAADQAKL